MTTFIHRFILTGAETNRNVTPYHGELTIGKAHRRPHVYVHIHVYRLSKFKVMSVRVDLLEPRYYSTYCLSSVYGCHVYDLTGS